MSWPIPYWTHLDTKQKLYWISQLTRSESLFEAIYDCTALTCKVRGRAFTAKLETDVKMAIHSD